MTTLASTCRLSGEPLADADTLFEISDCPLPGIYPTSNTESLMLRSPLRVVQAKQSGFVQLAHKFDSSMYQQYSFAGGVSKAYRAHLDAFANEIAGSLSKSASILEVGCGDGYLLRRLRGLGFTDVLGIDPSRAAFDHAEDYLVSGYFPHDLPVSQRDRKFDLVITRHVLEHIETPRPFLAALADSLVEDGQLWIEVPDLISTLTSNLWSNFYHLHCNYFSAITLNQMSSTAGLRCISEKIVDVFGGSLLHKYVRGHAIVRSMPPRLEGVGLRVGGFREKLLWMAQQVPAGTVGYGAAERTAVTLGFAPEVAASLTCLYDGNPLLSGRFLAGTSLPILGKEVLYLNPPAAILIFAISNSVEILNEWQERLPGDVIVGLMGGSFPLKPLREYR